LKLIRPVQMMFAFVAACIGILAFIPHAQAETSCTRYQSFFDSIHARNAAWLDGQAASGDGPTYYSFSYILGGTLAMFQGTNDVKYLDRMFRWTDAMIAAARTTDEHGRKNWSGNWSSPWAKQPIAYMLEDLQGGAELARLARVTLTDSFLESTHGGPARKAYGFVKDHIIDKWLFKRDAKSWFLNVAHDESRLYSDKVAFLVRILLDLYQIDGNATYSLLASDLLESFTHRLTAYTNSSLIWDLTAPGKAPDTSHANRIPYMLVDAYESGVHITSTQLKGLSNLLTSVIWDRSSTSPRFRNYIDGDNSDAYGRAAWNNGQIYSGWVTLGAYDPTVQHVAESVLAAMIAGVRNPSLDYMNSVYGKIALAGFTTRNMRVANTCF
jgi:hypothetical protein